MKRLLILVSILQLFTFCEKDEPICYECAIVTITNEPYICIDPEQIEVMEPQNVQIICWEAAKSEFMDVTKIVNSSNEIPCDGGVMISTTTRSPVCKEQT